MKTKMKGLTPLKRGIISLSKDQYAELMDREIISLSKDQYAELVLSVVIYKEAERERNVTEQWLYDARAQNYEKVLKKVMHSAPYDSSFKVSADQVQDYFHTYLLDQLIAKDQLKSHLEKGREINLNVVYVWFKQFCVREKFVEGQDALQRTRGARTQSEVTKIKSYENDDAKDQYVPTHHIRNLESSGFQVAQVLSKTDKETGQLIGDPDYFIPQSEIEDIEQRSMNDHVRSLLLNRFGEEKVGLYYSLYQEILYNEYEDNKRRWAESRQVTKRVLDYQIDQIHGLIRNNASDFGY